MCLKNLVLCRRSRDASKPQFISEFSVKASKRDTDSWRSLPSASSSDRAEPKRSVLSLSPLGRLCLLMLRASAAKLWATGVLTMQLLGESMMLQLSNIHYSLTSDVSTCTSPVLLGDAMADHSVPPSVVSLGAKDIFATRNNLKECSVHCHLRWKSTPHSDFKQVSVCAL